MSKVAAGEAYIAVTCDNDALKKGLKEVGAIIDATAKDVSVKEKDLTPKINVDSKGAVDALKDVQKATRDAAEEAKGFNAVFAVTAGDVWNALKGVAMSVGNLLSGVGDQFDKMSQRVGVSTSALSEYAHAAAMSGGDISNVEGALRSMATLTLNASNGMAKATKTFERLNIDLEEFKNLSPEEQFDKLASTIASIEDPTRRAAEAMKVFGGDGQKLLPLFAAGADGLAEMREEARQLGVSIDESAAKMGADVNDAMARLSQSFKGLSLTLAKEVTPSLISFFNNSAKVVSSIIGFAKENPTLTKTLVSLTAVIGGTTIAIIAASKASAVWSAGFMQLKGAIAAARAIIATFATSVGAATAAATAGIGALVAGIVYFTTTAEKGADKARDLAQATQERAQANEAARQKDAELFKELQNLANQGSLTNEEFVRGKQIVSQLTSKYGDLGISVDDVAKKFGMATDAKAKFDAKMRESQKKDIEAQIKELENANKEIDKSIQKYVGDGFRSLAVNYGQEIGSWFGGDTAEERVDALGNERAANSQKISALRQELEGIKELEEDIETAASGVDSVAGSRLAADFIAQGTEDLRTELEKQVDTINAKKDEVLNGLRALFNVGEDFDWSNKEAVDALGVDDAAKETLKQMVDVEESAQKQIKRIREKADADKARDASQKAEQLQKQIADAMNAPQDANGRAQREIELIQQQTEEYKKQLQTLLDLEKAKEGGGDQKVIEGLQKQIKDADADEATRINKVRTDRQTEVNQKFTDSIKQYIEKFGTPIQKLELAEKNLASATAALRDAQAGGDREQIAAALNRLGEAQTQYLDAQEASKKLDRSVKSLGGTFDAWQAVSLTRQATYEKKAYDEARAQTRYLAEISRKIGYAFFG